MDLPAIVEHAGGTFVGLVENLSAGGAFVATHGLAEMGDRVRVVISLPQESDVLHAVCQVRWLREDPPSMGLKFTEIAPESRQALLRFVMSLG